jgi:hypothetical protein
MSYQIVKDYLQSLESADYAQFTGTGYKLVNSGVEIEFGNEGFEVDGEVVNVEDVKALVKQALGKAEAPAKVSKDAVKSQPGTFRLIDIKACPGEAAKVIPEIEAIAASGQYQPATLPVVRQKVGPEGITYEVLEGHEVLAIAKAVKSVNPRIELVPAWVTEMK